MLEKVHLQLANQANKNPQIKIQVGGDENHLLTDKERSDWWEKFRREVFFKVNEAIIKNPEKCWCRDYTNNAKWELDHDVLLVDGHVMAGALDVDTLYFKQNATDTRKIDETELMKKIPVRQIFTKRLGKQLMYDLLRQLALEGTYTNANWSQEQDSWLPSYVELIHDLMQKVKKKLPKVREVKKNVTARKRNIDEHRLTNFYDADTYNQEILGKTLKVLNGDSEDFKNNDTWKFNLVLWAKGNKKEELCKLLNYSHKKFLKREAELKYQNNNNNNQNLNNTNLSNPTPPPGVNQPPTAPQAVEVDKKPKHPTSREWVSTQKLEEKAQWWDEFRKEVLRKCNEHAMKPEDPVNQLCQQTNNNPINRHILIDDNGNLVQGTRIDTPILAWQGDNTVNGITDRGSWFNLIDTKDCFTDRLGAKLCEDLGKDKIKWDDYKGGKLLKYLEAIYKILSNSKEMPKVRHRHILVGLGINRKSRTDERWLCDYINFYNKKLWRNPDDLNQGLRVYGDLGDDDESRKATLVQCAKSKEHGKKLYNLLKIKEREFEDIWNTKDQPNPAQPQIPNPAIVVPPPPGQTQTVVPAVSPTQTIVPPIVVQTPQTALESPNRFQDDTYKRYHTFYTDVPSFIKWINKRLAKIAWTKSDYDYVFKNATNQPPASIQPQSPTVTQ